METNRINKTSNVIILVLRLFLFFIFLVVGVVKLIGIAQTKQLFTAIGWGQWFRYLTGILDVIGALLLIVPRWTFYGALILICTIGSATMFYLLSLHNNPTVPLVLTLLVATLAWMTRRH
jgi:uncharacterized membrane protein YphA (DoxX/SURF4 family)